MTTIGVDLHKYQLNTVVLDEQGTVRQRRELSTKCRHQIREYFASFGPHCQVAVESVGFYQWFWKLVRPEVSRLVLADPAGPMIPRMRLGGIEMLRERRTVFLPKETESRSVLTLAPVRSVFISPSA